MPKSQFSRLSSVFAVTAILLVLTATSTRSAEIAWTNVAGGNWATAANWSPNQVPGTSDNVYITNNGTYQVAITANAGVATLTAGGLTGTQTLTLSGAFTFTINNPSLLGTNCTLNLNATIDGPGDITVAGLLSWQVGAIQGSGRIIVANTGRLLLSTLNNKSVKRTLQNDGAVVWTGGPMELTDCAFTNNGTLTVSNSTQIQFAGSGSGPNIFNNGPGAIFIKQGAGELSFFNAGTPVPFTNSGTVDVQAGTLTLLSGGANSSTITIQSAGTISFGSRLTHLEGSSLSGSGTITFSSGTNSFPAGTFTPTGTVNFSGGTITINNTFSPAALGTIGATATFNNVIGYSGPVNITGVATFAAAQNFSSLMLSGTLDGAGDITVNGPLSWTGGTMQGNGRTTVANTGTLGMSANGKSLKRILQNDGSALWTAGSLQLTNAAITNTGTFTVSNSAALSCSGAAPGPNVFNNSLGATFTKQGTGTFTFSNVGTGLPFNNSGTADVQAGTLTLAGGGTNSNTLTVQNVGTILFSTNYTYLPGSSLTGSGTNTFGNGTHHFPAGTFTPTGTVNFSSGTIIINNTFSPAALGTIAATATFSNAVNYSGPVNISGIATFAVAQNFGSLTLSGTLDGAGDVTVTGPSTWSGGTMQGSGKTIVANTGTLNLSTGAAKNLSRILQNNGSAVWTGGAIILSGSFNNSGSFTVSNSTVSLNFQGGPPGPNAFNNNVGGIFTKQGTGTVSFAVGGALPFNNSGTMDVQAGNVIFRSDYTQTEGQTILSGGAISLASAIIDIQGGTLAGSGTIFGTVNSSGIVSPGASPGLITINGTFTQFSSGALNIEIAGTSPGTNFDRLSVTGSASLAGTLNVTLTNGFSPATNAAFTFLTCSSRSGTFGTFNYPSNELGLQVAYTTTNATINVINVRPVLPAFLDQTNDELVLFNLNAAGADADVPVQTLTYSLTNSPAGAEIDPGTGLISWTPTEPQGPMTTNITVLVRDNGTPNLTSSRTFQFVVNEVNASPSLTVPDKLIHAGALLATAAIATDPDVPTNRLTFQLVSGPGGLTVTTNGLMTWVTSDALATTTNPVTMRVFDDGSPVLSKTQSFNVVILPRPLLASPLISTNNVVLSWSAIPGTSYRVQASSNLTSGTWSNLAGDVTAVTTNAAKVDSQIASRLYRVQVLP